MELEGRYKPLLYSAESVAELCGCHTSYCLGSGQAKLQAEKLMGWARHKMAWHRVVVVASAGYALLHDLCVPHCLLILYTHN